MTEASYIPLTAEALEDIKEYIKKLSLMRSTDPAKPGRKSIEKVETLPDGRVAIYVMFDHEAPDEINGIRFYHRDGFMWAGGNENLNKAEFDEGIQYRYTLKIVQTSAKS